MATRIRQGRKRRTPALVAPEPLGHDPYAIWPDGPSNPDAGVLRLRPWRLRVATMETLLGRSKPLVWTHETLNQPS